VAEGKSMKRVLTLAVIGALAQILLMAWLLSLAMPARADEMVAGNMSGDEVHLVDRPCDNAATLARIKRNCALNFVARGRR
jgi:hypothetical protein